MCHCSSGSRMKGNKTEMYHWTLVKNCSLCLVFSFFEQYQSEYHCYSKYLALFCLEARDFQMSAVSDTRRPVHRWGSREWCGEGGVSTECLSAVVLWVSSGSPPPHSAALPPGLHLTLPSEEMRLLQDRQITALCRTRHPLFSKL